MVFLVRTMVYNWSINSIMKKIFEWLSNLEKDKILHDDVCFTISLIAACICRIFCKDWQSIVVASFFTSFVFAIGKEIYDEWKYKGADERDWLADIVGIVRGTLIAFLLTV